MRTVRRIMEMVALEGCTLYEVGRRLRDQRIRTAKGGVRWDARVIKSCITGDVYLPRTHRAGGAGGEGAPVGGGPGGA